jgi:hypothetical protein
VLEHLKAGCKGGESLLEHSAKVLKDSQEARAFWTSLRKDVSPHDYALAEEVMSAHSSMAARQRAEAAASELVDPSLVSGRWSPLRQIGGP